MINLPTENFSIFTGYRQPYANLNTFLVKIDEILGAHTKIIFLGDTNVDLFEKYHPNTVNIKETFSNNNLACENSDDSSMLTRASRTGENSCIDDFSVSCFIDNKVETFLVDVSELSSYHKSALLTVEKSNTAPRSNLSKNLMQQKPIMTKLRMKILS